MSRNDVVDTNTAEAGHSDARALDVRLLAEAVSHLAEGIMITDDDLDWPGPRIRFVNEAMCRITGYATDELLGKTPRILQGAEVESDPADRLKTELAAGRSVVCETIFRRKDGTDYDAELFVSPLLDASGSRRNFVSILRDITARKHAERALRESEERNRAILSAAVDAIITIDRHGIILDANSATEKMFGFTRSELVGQNVNILMPSPFHEEHDRYIARYMATGKPHVIGTGRELVGRRKDGSNFPIWLSVGEVDHLRIFTGIVHDLTTRKALEKHLLNIAAEEQRRIGQELHDGTSQELTGLSLMVATLLEALRKASSFEDDGFKKWVIDDTDFQRLQKAAKRLSQGLDATNRHIDELSHGIMPVEVDAEGLRAALSELAATIDGNDNIHCRFECPEAFTVPNNDMATHLYRIAQEALNNAIRHGRADKIHIALSKRNDHIVLEVDDNGIGFDPIAHRAHQRIDKGMGLSSMEYRAGAVGGVLRIERKPQGGMHLTCSVMRGASHEG